MLTLDEKLNACGITKKDFRKALGVCPATISQWFSGKRIPRAKYIREIEYLTDGTITSQDFINPVLKKKLTISSNKKILSKINNMR